MNPSQTGPARLFRFRRSARAGTGTLVVGLGELRHAREVSNFPGTVGASEKAVRHSR
jgi:hypothetical protein